ncbi:hypothetical protein N7466_000936 [Penicillium verhagenii]|uniref:uncharacterized protein n=1 Tax=Penicillium verhagenii TaxID=1562060 RepID=UPI002545BCE6|nr:uncharacterized protein N7466_000936 [Penicillium verhagenii]KAJ5947921.1 hypothetical protein N7466_000936 [Penicillium verhagenii]
MLSLGTEVAIAASGAAIFVVFSAVAIVVWVRVRKERHALRVLGLRGEYRHSVGFTGDTLTELSREEGRALRAHNLPYGKPNEWGQANSREHLLRPKNGSDSSFPLMEKARSLRHSLSRSRSKRLSRSSQKHSRMSSMATVAETVVHNSPPRASQSRDDIPLSAVEGILELPTERTPRQTPDLNQEEQPGFHLGMRPVSPAWPLPSQKDRSGLFPVVESRTSQEMFDPPPRIFEESPSRVRGTSLTSQTPGIVPERPIPPPPPTAFQPDRMSYLRNDSIMRLSSMSLDTTNSSILEDTRQGPRSLDTELTSPIFPSGATSVPFSASDVGVKNGRRSFIAANTSMPPLHNFPVRSSSTAEGRKRSSIMDSISSPRRSLTTTSRNPSTASENRFSFTPIPRRHDSISSNGPSRHPSIRAGTPVSMNGHQAGPVINWRHSSSSMSFVPQYNVPQYGQFQQPAVWEGEHYDNDPFYGGSPQSNGTLFSIGSPGQTVGSMPQSPMQRSSLSLRGQPLPSALKSSNSQRKGHRRQNCVRISIHPPMTFGGPAFSPTVEEEPEDLDAMEELDLRESAINGNFKNLPSLPPPAATTSPSPLSKRTSRRNKPAHSTLGPLAEEPASVTNKSPPNKDQNQLLTSANLFSKDRDLPELFTSLPTDGGTLTHTPSPEHNLSVWAIPEEAPSPSYENHFSTGSPRRTPLKGPRTQPGRSARSNSTPKPMEPLPLMGVGSPTGLPLITGTQGSDWRRSTDSLFRTNTDATRNRDSNGSSLGLIGPSILADTAAFKSRQRSGTVKDRVTIWEDANRSGSPPKPSAAHLDGDYVFSDTNSSPTRLHNSIPRSLSKNGHSPYRVPSQRAPPTPNSAARRGLITPTGKRLGLGIGTPGSLYDGDGFLRE